MSFSQRLHKTKRYLGSYSYYKKKDILFKGKLDIYIKDSLNPLKIKCWIYKNIHQKDYSRRFKKYIEKYKDPFYEYEEQLNSSNVEAYTEVYYIFIKTKYVSSDGGYKVKHRLYKTADKVSETFSENITLYINEEYNHLNYFKSIKIQNNKLIKVEYK